jgi:hypothetical protein
MSQKSIVIKVYRKVKRVFDNVLLTDIMQVSCLTEEESSAKCAAMCHKSSKIKTKKYFDYHTKYLIIPIANKLREGKIVPLLKLRFLLKCLQYYKKL